MSLNPLLKLAPKTFSSKTREESVFYLKSVVMIVPGLVPHFFNVTTQQLDML